MENKKRQKPVCAKCGSESVTMEGSSRWSIEKQDWELAGTFDNTDCDDCGGECSLNWVELDSAEPGDWKNFSLPDAVRSYESEIILKALKETGGRITKAATLLGLSHQSLSLTLAQRHKELRVHAVQRKPRADRAAVKRGGN